MLFIFGHVKTSMPCHSPRKYNKRNINHTMKQNSHTFLQNEIKFAIKYPSPQFIRTQIQTKPNNTGFREQR